MMSLPHASATLLPLDFVANDLIVLWDNVFVLDFPSFKEKMLITHPSFQSHIVLSFSRPFMIFLQYSYRENEG